MNREARHDCPGTRPSNFREPPQQAVSAVAGGLDAVLGVAAIASSGGGAAGAATTYTTHASGRFLSGTNAGQQLDIVAGIEGETPRTRTAGAVVNQNSLKAELAQQGDRDSAAGRPAAARPRRPAPRRGCAVRRGEPVGQGDRRGRAVPTTAASAWAARTVCRPTHAQPRRPRRRALADVLTSRPPSALSPRGPLQAPGGHGRQTATTRSPAAGRTRHPVARRPARAGAEGRQPLLNTLTNAINNLPLGAGDPDQLPSLSKLLSNSEPLLLNGHHRRLNHGKIVVDLEKILQAIGLDLNNCREHLARPVPSSTR